MAEEPRTRDIWDKIPIISGLLAAVAVPVAIAVVGSWYTQANKEQELKLSQQAANKEWVQIGIDILRDPNVAPSIRKWGIQIVSRYGGIQIDEDVKDALTEGAVLPQSSVQQAALPADAAMASTTGRVAAIGQLQEKGISALLAKDLDGASAAYDEAYLIWPTFRNVDEIRRAIHEAAKQPQGANWQQLYRAIAAMDLRGVSSEVQDRLRTAAGG
jgi:hypothetical protein